MDVTCLAVDRKGVLYAGTSPNGKIYKITAKGKAEEFFDPSEKYVWNLFFMDNGELWRRSARAAGSTISPLGDGRMIFKAAENHVLCLEGRPAGTSSPARAATASSTGSARTAATVIFETPFEEVRSLALDLDGKIYAAAGGSPTRARKDERADEPVRLDAEVTVTVSAAGGASRPTAERAGPGDDSAGRGGPLPDHRRRAGQAPVELRGRDDLHLVLEGDRRQGPLRHGREGPALFGRPGGEGDPAPPAELRAGLSARPARFQTYVLANNPCYFGLLLPEQRFGGEYTGPVLDARTLASWGHVVWDAAVAAGASVQLQSRSGNTNEPNATWSDWSPFYGKTEEQVLSPKSRYLQVKILLRTQTGKSSPVFDRLAVFYLQSNVAPSVSRIEFLRPNEVYLKLPDQDDVILGVERNAPETPTKKDELRVGLGYRKSERKGFQTVVWDAADENGDTLRYSLAMKKDGETEWRVLEPDWTETIYAFDTLSFPDGTYLLRLTASDAPSNPGGLELKADKTSPSLVIDNSLPVVKGFTATRNGASLDVAFQAEDAYSYIEEVKVLVRPGEWRVVFPVDGIADSRTESFKFAAKLPAGAENQVTVRVRDSYGNVGVFRQGY